MFASLALKAGKPVLRWLAGKIILEEGTRMLAKLKASLAGQGREAIDERIDKFQTSLKARLLNLPLLPQDWKNYAAGALDVTIDLQQAKLDAALESPNTAYALDKYGSDLQQALLRKANDLIDLL